MKNFNFIKTSFEEVAQQLRNLGFREVQSEDNEYIFVNDTNKLDLDNDIVDKKKIRYSNMLNI